MAKKPTKSGNNPYKVLIWMGVGTLLLLLGVLALAVLMKPEPYAAPDPERTVLWLFDEEVRGGPANVSILEESRTSGKLRVVALAATEPARNAFADGGSRRAVEQLAETVERQLHHRVFLPYSVVATLIDAAGGIEVEESELSGSRAVQYIKEGEERSARRAALVMLGLANAVATRGVNMGMSEGLALARKVDTDLELTAIPDVLGRWSGYAAPQVEAPASPDWAALKQLLLPDPEPETEG